MIERADLQPVVRWTTSVVQAKSVPAGTARTEQPAGKGARDHDALDPKVEHTGALAQQYAQRAQDQRCCDAQHGDPEGLVGEDVKEFAHFIRTRYCVKSVATSTEISEAATMTSAM